MNPVAPAELDGGRRKRRPRPKLRYSTSESSYDDTDDDESDDEPPWWTFTQRGMHKLKLRNMRLQEAGQPGAGGTDDSGKEDRDKEKDGERGKPASVGGRKRQKKRFSGGQRDGQPLKRGSSGHEGSKRWSDSRDPTPKTSLRNVRRAESPKPIRPPLALPPNMRMSTPAFLRSKKEGSGTPPLKIKMKRRYSAPSSPVPDVESVPSIALITSPTDGVGPSRPVPLHESLPIHPVSSMHSILSIPRPPFMKRHSESLTDTEAVASHSIRLKAKRAQSNVQDREDSAAQQESGTSTPMRRGKERKQTISRLKINLPDQVTQHFSHGWPHAGTWQDALYGYYDEVPKDKDGLAADSRKSSKEIKNRSSSMTHQPPTIVATPEGLSSPGRDYVGSDSASPAPPPNRRAKSRRRKYRQALAPPTPSGLGFTDAEKGHGPRQEAWKQGKVVDGEFDWGMGANGHANGHGHTHSRITEEGGELSRTETRQTMTEKVGSATRNAKVKVKRKVAVSDGMDWKQRVRRIMFLDARVTIWIRFMNLAVAVCSLGRSS